MRALFSWPACAVAGLTYVASALVSRSACAAGVNERALEASSVESFDSTIPHSPPRHLGLGVRVAMGIGGLSSNLGRDWNSAIGAPEDDTALSLDLVAGTALDPDVFIGGAILLETAMTNRQAVYGSGGMGLPSVTRRTAFLGPFVEVYPDSLDGFYLGGSLGASSLRFDNPASATAVNTLGVGGAIWAGEDFWISSAWAVGPRARFLCERTWTVDATSSQDAWGDSLMLSFSVLYQ